MGDGMDSTRSIGSDGTIYFGSDDKKQHGIGTGKLGSEPWGPKPLFGVRVACYRFRKSRLRFSVTRHCCIGE
jgi:hypothetical protein